MAVRLQALVSHLVTVHPEETPTLLYASASFFFDSTIQQIKKEWSQSGKTRSFSKLSKLLSAYFMVIPFRDEAAISLGTNALPMLFFASLVLTLIAAPLCSHLLSLPAVSKSKALLILYRFFGVSLVLFFILYIGESSTFSFSSFEIFKVPETLKEGSLTFKGLRVCFYIWIGLLNLFTTSALWARLADIMSSEAGARLFGFVGAGATLGQLVGSVFAVFFSRFGPFLLLSSALFMEFGAQCALRTGHDLLSCIIVPSSDSADSQGRRVLLAKINSFTAVFILFGQLTITGRLLTYFGVTVALCASPVVAFINMTAISISPTPLVIAISEAIRKKNGSSQVWNIRETALGSKCVYFLLLETIGSPVADRTRRGLKQIPTIISTQNAYNDILTFCRGGVTH